MAGKNPSRPRRTTARTKLLAALRRYVRAEGAEHLRDPNVTSIGVGYKITGGKRTDEIALQFTVREKLSSPESLAATDTVVLPRTILVDGVEVPTDVLERDYAPAFRVVEAAVVERKTRIDPVVPGVSVSEVHGTAGTLGGIVYDRADGTPYVLSNWHVLHGPDGAIGNDVVQPGPHDDNRTDRNRLGRLVRSHLGAAGDCAVASISDRGFDAAIAGLDVVPTELGEPELDDTVVKSGRTTAVTHGIVRRVDVLVELNYGGTVGLRSIGGFEIGPDPEHPAPNDEISMGGDSGSLWMFTTDGEPGTVVAGLHFAGETAGETDEHALACLPASVFEKLEITLTPPGPEQITVAEGYDPAFLSTSVPLPTADGADAGEVVGHTHFSLQMDTARRFAAWVAWNIDGGSLKRLSRTDIRFVKDPDVPAEHQVGDELYADNDIDRGHLARRADLLWGPLPVAQKANTDSFFFTNITPQMNDFNQSARDGVWGRLEDAVFADVEVDDLRVSAFGGPVFQTDDRVYRGVALPREYWKVIVFGEDGTLKARAFLLTQNLDQLESLELDEFRAFQVPLVDVEKRTGLTFPSALHEADAAAAPEMIAGEPLGTTADIRW